jgi:hypothetical protein
MGCYICSGGVCSEQRQDCLKSTSARQPDLCLCRMASDRDSQTLLNAGASQEMLQSTHTLVCPTTKLAISGSLFEEDKCHLTSPTVPVEMPSIRSVYQKHKLT